ncbi:MAG: hypothetical protein PVJ01_03985 [Pseudomonadota bacterium]|jgi:hypothetical protein
MKGKAVEYFQYTVPSPALDTYAALFYDLALKEQTMDYLSPILGSVTGIVMSRWDGILVFGFKVFIFTLPFVVLGLIVERDVLRVPLWVKVVKMFLVALFSIPILLFAALNFLAPGLPDTFWGEYPFLERLWIMGGAGAPVILAGLTLLYLLVYLFETIRGDLRD